jgi:hypothetical protein
VVADEVITLVETLDLTGSFSVSVAESITVTEDPVPVLSPLFCLADDAIVVTDTPTVGMTEPSILYTTVTESVTLDETLTAYLQPLLAVTADDITIAETVSVNAGGLVLTADDSIVVTEEVGVCISPLLVELGDAIAVGESSEVGLNPILLSATETVTVAESPTLGVGGVPGRYLLANDAHWTGRCVKKERLINV